MVILKYVVPKASGERTAEFREVAEKMLGADAMVTAQVSAFNTSDQSVGPGQELRRFLLRTRVPATHGGEREKRPGSYSIANHQF